MGKHLSRAALLDATITGWARAVALADPSRLEVWEDLGLTMSQLRVLSILNRNPGMTAGHLAERLGVRPSTVTGIVDRLERQDLVARQADAGDRRVLTDHGLAVATDISRRGREFLGRILNDLEDDDLDQVHRAFAILTSHAEAMGLLAPLPAEAGAS